MPTSGGSAPLTWFTRARTSCRAYVMSVPGAKVIAISLAPRIECDRTRVTPRHDAHRFLERAGDVEDHLARAERGALGDDGDAGEHQLGIDRRRQAQGGPHAGGAEQPDEEIDEPALPAQHVEQAHRATRTIFALSWMP